ncbi:LacI family DNA-binding transcriptional regulator [Rubellicoccus peritrichatus]|uniref:LacI family DNA-binding transcriptional regulator n=1 Tax=Rubellicoccus peritrichatus TaxID=3080537 RepID=A0AAQ3QUC3_9BACT|nr:LacI family DNA-binding transcriptional regulator [Puniceicoccus sp. CR14]WOO40323.1 LacI family DNA-binding transcriptional regulator [Puniceicoccus sp. CR14]
MKSEKRPTLQDLIKKTGFSHGAISRAFNGQKGISDGTRALILKTAREIGYHPNSSARNFKRGYSGRIGIILPNLRNTNYAELYEQLDYVISQAGLSSVLALTHDDMKREMDIILHWSAGETDALILNPIRASENLDLYKKVHSWGYPLFFLYGIPGSDFDGIGFNYRNSLSKALKYLRDVGHRKVAYVGQIPLGAKPRGKYGILLEKLPEFDMEFDEKHSIFDATGDAAGPVALDRWNGMGSRPTAVVAYNDHTAGSLYYEALYRGMKVPEDFSLLGSDDVAEAKLIGLTTIRSDRTKIASEIFSMLQFRMKNPEDPPLQRALHCELVTRDSLGPAPKQ